MLSRMRRVNATRMGRGDDVDPRLFAANDERTEVARTKAPLQTRDWIEIAFVPLLGERAHREWPCVRESVRPASELKILHEHVFDGVIRTDAEQFYAAVAIFLRERPLARDEILVRITRAHDRISKDDHIQGNLPCVQESRDGPVPVGGRHRARRAPNPFGLVQLEQDQGPAHDHAGREQTLVQAPRIRHVSLDQSKVAHDPFLSAIAGHL